MPAPQFTALLFGLTGCLVDHGARTLPVALQHMGLRDCPEDLRQPQLLDSLLASANERAEALPGVIELLEELALQRLPHAALDELPTEVAQLLASALPRDVTLCCTGDARPWPAPDSLWQALALLQVECLEGCVLIASEPRLLQAGLNAGLWCIGLASCGSPCGLALADWQALPAAEREKLRAQATLELYRLGAHSVIDHPGELPACLHDLAARRDKGEKP
ncbi:MULTISPECIES: HAD family phosphatase [unclassified Pseudomonas]|uniref:HAD family phosphatase n=1 Tax=unclassified Pseudomonas TaxID=196821 RepID=UPI0024482162|nr:MULTISPECIES: HAD family phosphatase [unclassified Pseudomonas]MDH0894841.1 HAD family phosphatase [Pseudomonas sp. GD03875]MDH1063961.1 HAD family phosphatase [Pseudomonas sp. GD03985]